MVSDAPYPTAPRWRRTLAGLLDAGLVAALAWVIRARAGDSKEAARRLGWLRFVPAEALREQVRTPGQRLLGVRTVDRRTGRRVAVWRTALLVGVASGGHAAVRRIVPDDAGSEREAESRAISEQLDEIRRSAPTAEAQREQMAAVFERHKRPAGREAGQAMAAALGVSLITARLRRRLAPTVEVLARGRGDHSP